MLNQKGFSLVQVMVAAGLLGGIALIATQLTSNMNKGLKNAESTADVQNLVQQIQRLLANPDNCTPTFIGKNAKETPNAVKFIVDNSAGVAAENYKVISHDPKVRYGQGQLRIKSYALSEAGDAVDVETLRTTNLIITFDKGAGGLMKESSKKISLKVEVDGDNKITSCIATTNASDNIWKFSSNNMDIFFNGGNVGIGTVTPIAPLEIKSTGNMLRLTNETATADKDAILAYIGFHDMNGKSLGYIGDGSVDDKDIQIIGHNGYGLMFVTLDGESEETYRGSIRLEAGTGNVGIGTALPQTKLDVAGSIRPGSAGVIIGGACAPEGALAYDQTAHKPVFCSESLKWMGMGAPDCTTREKSTVNDIEVNAQAPAVAECEDNEVVIGGACSFQQHHYSLDAASKCNWTQKASFTTNGYSCHATNDKEENCTVRPMTITSQARCCKK